VLAAFGGAGPLHAAALASELGIGEVICPPIPGAFSALGLIATDLKRDYVQTLSMRTDTADPLAVEAAFIALEKKGGAMLDGAAIGPERRRFERSVDARYERQSYELTVPVPACPIDQTTLQEIAETFHLRHCTPMAMIIAASSPDRQHSHRCDWHDPAADDPGYTR
jgi:N-methylhydantoinase A